MTSELATETQRHREKLATNFTNYTKTGARFVQRFCITLTNDVQPPVIEQNSWNS